MPDQAGRRNPRHTTYFDELVAALRAHARGLYHAVAAVELLIGHRRWLCRDDFVGRFVWVGRGMAGGGLLAVVDWPAAVKVLAVGGLPCSGSEGCGLRIAASIAADVPVDLGSCLSTLDAVDVGLVVRAVLAAGGRHGAAAGFSGVAW
jgi:hypothetical protein